MGRMLSLESCTSDLNIIWGLHKVRASNGTIRNKTGSITRLSRVDELYVAREVTAHMP